MAVFFVLIAAAERRGATGLIETGGAVALIVSGELLVRSGETSFAFRDGFSGPGRWQASWFVFALFVTGLIWFLARFQAARRWEFAARVAQKTQARVSMELHDTVVQSLYNIECRLEKLRSRADDLSPDAMEDLSRLQQLLHRAEVKLRDIVRQGRPPDIASKSFIQYVKSVITEFERETGVAVSFSCDSDRISPPPAVACELVRIVQEALQNIRKHSGARNVSMGWRFAEGCWRFWIDDDGQGFDFSGRLGMLELENLSQGPFVIRERVSTLGGELAVESTPGRGARLEIVVPKDALG